MVRNFMEHKSRSALWEFKFSSTLSDVGNCDFVLTLCNLHGISPIRSASVQSATLIGSQASSNAPKNSGAGHTKNMLPPICFVLFASTRADCPLPHRMRVDRC